MADNRHSINKYNNMGFIFKKNAIDYIKILVLLFFSLGCNEDESTVSDEGLVLGSWEGFAETAVYEDGRKEPFTSGICQGGNIYEFFEDGRLFYVDFIRDMPDGCIEDQETRQFGTWERITQGKYRFNIVKDSDGSEIAITPFSIEFPEDGFMDIRFEENSMNAPDGVVYTYMSFSRR